MLGRGAGLLCARSAGVSAHQQPGVHKEEDRQQPSVGFTRERRLVVDEREEGAHEEEGARDDAEAGRGAEGKRVQGVGGMVHERIVV